MRRGVWTCGLIAMAVLALVFFRQTREPILSKYSFSHTVRDRSGKLLRFTLSGDEKYRLYTSSSEIPNELISAILLHEDRHFYWHFGVNPVSLVKAALNTYVKRSRRMGGSTLTMQLVRLSSLRGSKTIYGKLLQVARALYLETTHSKREILEAYLNLLPYGRNIEGIGAASLIYFGKPVKDLSLSEIFSLAVIPQNPNSRNLWDSGLRSESEQHWLTSRARLVTAWNAKYTEKIQQEQFFDLPLLVAQREKMPFLAPHFVNLVLDRTRGSDFTSDFTKWANIDTTLDLGVQNMLERKLKAYVHSKSPLGIKNAAAMVVDTRTMNVIAQVGSADFNDIGIEGQVNGALGRRSPGSALKPFVYALALDQGLIHPLSLLKDTPIAFGGFDPENFDRRFEGPVTATEALIQSRNIPAVYLAALLQANQQMTLYDFLKNAGVARLREPGHYGLALTLGAAEVTMEELVRLYSVLANLGQWRELKYFTGLSEAEPRQLISPEAAFLTLDMLRQNPRDEQRLMDGFLQGSVPVAWKTGTSYAFRDAWTVGIVGPYVVAVWLGNFNGDENHALVGREMAAPLFFRLVDGLKPIVKSAPEEAKWLSPRGLNLKKVGVCALSGNLPNRHCQHLTETWFIPGRSPIAECQIHREVQIAKGTGLRVCNEARTDVEKKIFEFWPSDILQVFRLAGIPRKSPPRFETACAQKDMQSGGLAPRITSPKRDVVYSYRVGRKEVASTANLALSAVADGDAHTLHWFVGSEYLGKSDPESALFWTPRVGHYIVRVVDDLGRSDSRPVDVQVSR